MKLRIIAIILLLSLLLFFGFKKVSANKNKELSTNIEQLNILKYIPQNNKLLFISNLDSFNIVNNNEKDKNPKNQDKFVLIFSLFSSKGWPTKVFLILSLSKYFFSKLNNNKT